MRPSFWISLPFLFVGLPFGVAAQQEHSAAESAQFADAPQRLRKVSVTATRGEREVDRVAGTVTIIDEEQIRSQLSTDIKDLIRYEPGISVADSANRFGLAGFNIRGIDANRVLLRVDGVPMADAFSIGSFSDTRRNLIDLEAVKAVEIIRGPSSALYGSDAIGGVVSFVMKEPEDYLQDGRSTYAGVRSGFQSDDEGWYSGGTLALGGERLSGVLLYTHRAGHETDNRGSVDSRDRSRTKPNPKDYDSDAVLAKFGWNPADDHRFNLTLEANRSDATTDVFSSVGVFGANETLGMRGDDEQRRSRVSIGHEAFGDSLLFDRLRWLAYAQRSEVEQRTNELRYPLSAGPGATVQRDRVFDFDQKVLGAEVILYKELSLGQSHHRFTYGIDITQTETEQLRDGVQTHLASGEQTANILPDDFPVRDFPLSETLEYGLYVQDEIELGRGAWWLVPGIRVDRYRLDPDADPIFLEDNPAADVVGVTRTSTTPKLGLIRSLGEHNSLFAQYARGFRAPPYADVNIGFTNLAFGYTALANPDLKPETSDGYELGLRGSFPSGSYDLTAFYNEYDDFIESLANVGVQNGLLVFQSRNVDRANIRGVEFKGNVDLGGLWPRLSGWRVRTSVAWARGENRVTDEPLNSVDPLKGVLGFGYEPAHGRWGVDLVGTGTDRKSRVDDSTNESFVPDGYLTLDLMVHAVPADRWRIHAGVFNLTDEKYWEWADVRGRAADEPAIDRYTRPGINASASLTFSF